MTPRTLISRQWIRVDDQRPPLTWLPVILDGERTASVVCANGHTATAGEHSIGHDGKVNPSVVCPYECDWHEWITLADWETPEPN